MPCAVTLGVHLEDQLGGIRIRAWTRQLHLLTEPVQEALAWLGRAPTLTNHRLPNPEATLIKACAARNLLLLNHILTLRSSAPKPIPTTKRFGRPARHTARPH